MDVGDSDHAACLRLLEEHRGSLFVPTLVIAEVAHFIGRRAGAEAEVAFLADVGGGGLEPMPVETSDWPRIMELVWTYRDLPLGTVDASVVALAERLKIRQIATLDHRHFSVVRPIHTEAFVLLPLATAP